MKLETILVVLLLVTLWVFGGMVAILLIAIENKKRLGGKLFFHIKEDIRESPIPALLGYIFVFVFSWLSFARYCFALFFEAIKFLTLFIKRFHPKKG